jgi:hypothetical protein
MWHSHSRTRSPVIPTAYQGSCAHRPIRRQASSQKAGKGLRFLLTKIAGPGGLSMLILSCSSPLCKIPYVKAVGPRAQTGMDLSHPPARSPPKRLPDVRVSVRMISAIIMRLTMPACSLQAFSRAYRALLPALLMDRIQPAARGC